MFLGDVVNPPPIKHEPQKLNVRMSLAGSLHRLCARFSRRSVCLFELDDVTRSSSITNRYDVGLQSVAIRRFAAARIVPPTLTHTFIR
jgi:hypothetical protein